MCEVTQILECTLYKKKQLESVEEEIFQSTAGFQLLTAAWVMVEVLRYVLLTHR